MITLEFGINVLTLNKNHVLYTAEDKAADNRVEDNVAHNRTVEAEMTFRDVVTLSL